MKLKIISDETSCGTKVVNAETGELLDDVVRIEWACTLGETPLATIVLRDIPIELTCKPSDR